MGAALVSGRASSKTWLYATPLLILLAWVFSMPAQAQAQEPSPKAWLEKMSSAMQELNYRGVFIYRRGESLEAMKVTHVVDNNGGRELLETLTGDARRELRQTQREQTAKQTGVDSAARLARIDSFYLLKVVGSDRVAGRATQLLHVTPKDEFRYGYRLWLDEATGLLLKSDLMDQQGEVLEQVMFTSVELLRPEQAAKVLPAETGAAAVQEKIVPNPDSQWRFEQLPQGFELLGMQSNTQRNGIEHMVFSDGLASVSVFVEPAKAEADALVGLSSMGAVNAFGGINNGYQVTVVGEVPAATVQAICQSIKQRGQTP